MEKNKNAYEAPVVDVLKLYSEDVMSNQDYVSGGDDGIHLPPMPLD